MFYIIKNHNIIIIIKFIPFNNNIYFNNKFELFFNIIKNDY